MTLSLNLNIADVLESKYPHGFHVPVDIDISQFLEFADDDWDHLVDIDAHLEAEGQIALIWSVDDVLERRTDLNEEQAWKVLSRGREEFTEGRCHLEFLEVIANRLFPVGVDAAELVKERLRALLAQVEATPAEFLADIADVERTREQLDALEQALQAGERP